MRLPKAVVNAVRNLLLIATLAATTGMAGQSDQRESYLCSWYAYYWNPTVVTNGQSKDYRQEDYGPDIVNELACRFMERNKAELFFLYYTISLPHDPFLPTPDSGVADLLR